MSYMFCEDYTDSIQLLAEAKREAEQILQELPAYVNAPKGAIGIDIQRVCYPFTGWAIEADLTFGGEVVRHYDSFELLVLDLTLLELKALTPTIAKRRQ